MQFQLKSTSTYPPPPLPPPPLTCSGSQFDRSHALHPKVVEGNSLALAQSELVFLLSAPPPLTTPLPLPFATALPAFPFAGNVVVVVVVVCAVLSASMSFKNSFAYAGRGGAHRGGLGGGYAKNMTALATPNRFHQAAQVVAALDEND